MRMVLRTGLRRFRIAGAAALLVLLSFGAGTPAVAQGLDFFGGILGGGTPQRQARPDYPGYGYGNDDGYDRRPRRSHRRAKSDTPRKSATPASAAATAPGAAPKKNATIFVDVYGDSVGQMLASGLDEAFADRTDVGIVPKAKGSTGLVVTSFYDWPKVIDQQLASKDATDKIDVAVMMIGINDRQPITENGTTYEYDSDEWTAIYKKRVAAICEAFQKKNIPLIWVGLPITHDPAFANDMAAFNEIYREAAARTGAVYVDTWEAFSDDNGDFNAFGPDINGQIVRLRSADGIHFTPPGARKLAHFVETHIRRALDGKTQPVVLPTSDPAKVSDGGKPIFGPFRPAHAPVVAIVKPEVGPITNLNEVPTTTSGELAALPGQKPDEHANETIETVLVKGEPRKPVKGRADDFRWTPPAASAPH